MSAVWVASMATGFLIVLAYRHFSVGGSSLAREGGLRSRDAAEMSPLRRWRFPLAGLAGLAGWAFVGGAAGVVVAIGVSWLAARTLARARSPGEIRCERRLRADYPLVAELLVQALVSGADVESSLQAVGEAVGGPWADELTASRRALSLGTPASEVWAALEANPHTRDLGRALARAHEGGVPIAAAMRRLAESLRERADLDAQASARTIEVRAAVPLGVCFLPAFTLLGVVPLVASILNGLSIVGGG